MIYLLLLWGGEEVAGSTSPMTKGKPEESVLGHVESVFKLFSFQKFHFHGRLLYMVQLSHISQLQRPSPLLCGQVSTIIFQYCLFSVMSAVSSYLLISFRLLSIHLRLGRPLLLFPGTTMSIIFLEVVFFSSPDMSVPSYRFRLRKLTFGTLWHHLVLSGFWHGPFWYFPLSIVTYSYLLHANCSRLSF